MEYYVYQLIDPKNNKIFYVGKGQKKRLYEHVKNVQRGRTPNDSNKKLGNKIKKILSFGGKVKYKKVFITENGKVAFNKEVEWIAKIGLENLCNIAIGGKIGSGMLGRTHSEETKRKISESKKGYKHSKETKKKISEGNKGKIGYWKGKTFTEKHKQNVSKSRKGCIISEITKKKISKTLNGHKHSEETKKKISMTLKGFKHSEETKRKISQTKKLKIKK